MCILISSLLQMRKLRYTELMRPTSGSIVESNKLELDVRMSHPGSQTLFYVDELI